ncbi:unnamed protein product [Arctia plantaginis]|uniref:Major facilitator superfamily (MFS) profile domain-containing protein n=1 Tax=Arctia plantaginis TaxID=874455 RepID=A0A8S0Z6W1_ARCPL|nr:unnamed protein product [Arctia plantaginis]CAB3228216.1 unnamed protein product [Arctia plantaginis]
MVKKSFDVSVVMKENVELENAFDDTGHGRYNHILLVTSCMITIGAVMDMLGYSLVIPAASCDLNLTLEQGGILKSISFAGYVFAIPWGYIADTKGRRITILVSCTAGFVFSALASFSTTFTMMLVLKFLASCFSTASLTLITTYLGESTCKNKRNKYIFIQNISSTGSDFVCFVLGYLILPLDFAISVPYLNWYKSWRLFSFVMSLPLGLGAVMLYFLRETPKFLVYRGDFDQAIDVLRAMFKTNYGKDKVYPVISLMKPYKLLESSSFWDSVTRQVTPIFKPPLLWRSLQLFLLLSICCSTNNVFFMWFPTMVNSFFTASDEDSNFCQKVVANITPIKYNDVCIENSSMNTIYAGMLLTLLSTSLNIAVIAFANWRRTLIFTFVFVSGVCCITVNMFSDRIISMVLFCTIQFTLLSLGSIYSYYVDIFPTSCRGLATSTGVMIARMFCLSGVSIVGSTIVDNCELTFYCWAVFLFSGIIAAVFLPREATKQDICKT